ncbi:MAG TPA: hypothetical protein VJV78_39805 [Polyangiales bacterium]|nr:hypothetical protein [Polyangiales bacterium]
MPSALAACTTVGDQANALGVEHVDFADVWTASGYPCGPSRRSVTLQLTEIAKRLIARGTQEDECIAMDGVVFRATLPNEGGLPLSRLPLSVPAELTLGGSRPRTVNGHLNVQSADEMQLEAGDVTLGIMRRPAATTPPGSADMPAADSGMPPEVEGGTGGESDQPEAGAADSGMPPAGGSGDAGTGGTGGMQPPPTVTTSGGAGSSGSPAAGGGGAGGMIVSQAKGGSGGAVSGAGGASGMPAAGSGAWSCTPLLTACVCTHTQGSPSDTCNKTRPPCCFRATVRGEDRCQCWPENSSTCLTYRSISADARKVPTCPPQD